MTCRAAAVALCGALALAAQAPRGGLDVSTIDRSVGPQDDLFAHANGVWLRGAAIPGDRVTDGAFAEIADATEAQLRTIVEDVIAGRTKVSGSTRQQVTALYQSAVDDARIAAVGAAPLQPELARIDAIRSITGVAAEAGRLSSLGAGGPFDGGPVADPERRGQTIVRILPGGTLLPDLRYYVDADPAFVDARNGYDAYLRRVFTLTGRDAPVDAARGVLALVIEIARAEWRTVAPSAAPRRMTLRDLSTAMPGWDWAAWAQPQGLDRVPALLVERPSFFQEFAVLTATVPVNTWRNWLVARYVTAAAPYLSAPFDMARYDFFGATLTGQEEPRARWKRGVTLVSSYLPDVLGRLYVERYLTPAVSTRARRLLVSLVDAYRRALAAAPTRATRDAQQMLATMGIEVGRPGAWHDYGGLTVRPDDLFGNWLRAMAFESGPRGREAAGEPARTWARPPQTVNAYYDVAANVIVVPAALLQPPVFDAGAEDAVNYGAVGALAGHEIAHAFGADEDAADAVGLAMALEAYRLSLNGSPAPVIDGLSGEQRFFLSFARMWRSTERPAYRRSVAAGAYLPPRDRANNAAGSVEGFYGAFGVKPGDGMYRAPGARLRGW
jgi:predicted metalloendopeptidase